MSYILDIVLILVIALCAWRGYKSGIIISFIGIIAIIVSVFAGNLVAKTYHSDFAGVMHPFVGGMVDSAVSTSLGTEVMDREVAASAEDEEAATYIVLNLGAANKEEAEAMQVEKTGNTVYLVAEDAQEDVWTVSYATLRNMGLAEAPAEKLATEVSQEVTNVNQEMRDQLGDKLCDQLAFMVVFAAGFILAAILFVVIGNIIDIKFTLPGAEIVNDIGGAVFGAVRGIVIVLFIASIFRYAGLLLPETLIEKTWILEGLINHNAVAGAVGI